MKKISHSADVAIIGGGIVGLAHAYLALKQGLKVVLFERNDYVVNVAVRNFGLIWPIGERPGPRYSRGLRGISYWKALATEAEFWFNQNGSLHVAMSDQEWKALNEFYDMFVDRDGYELELLDKNRVEEYGYVLNHDLAKGGLFSKTEATVNPREAIRKLSVWLETSFDIELRYGHTILNLAYPSIVTNDEHWEVGNIVICSELDFRKFYPELYSNLSSRDKYFQMLKVVSIDDGIKLGPSICNGLLPERLGSFQDCPSFAELVNRGPEQRCMLLTQNNHGELIVDDAHFENFISTPTELQEDNPLLTQLHAYFKLQDCEITEKWLGIQRLTDPMEEHILMQPQDGVYIVNVGERNELTSCFGLAEEVIQKFTSPQMAVS